MLGLAMFQVKDTRVNDLANMVEKGAIVDEQNARAEPRRHCSLQR